MTLWIIEPRDPLIVRDGRPFGPNPGARATTLPFPFPSTVVGALRHKAGLDDSGQFNRDRIATILKYGMRGPLLVQLDDHDAIIDWFLSAPADTLLLEPEKSANDVQGKQDRVLRRWLAPRALTATTNMLDDLSLVAPAERVFQKSSATAPRFWDRDTFYNWLITPTDDEPVRHSLGIHGLETNTRTHVSILPEHQTAREGALFQTSGLEFTWRDWQAQQEHDQFITRRLALAAWFDGATPQFKGGCVPLGGERRLMHWGTGQVSKELYSDAERDCVFTRIKDDRRCRVVLLTPAYFTKGYRPALEWVRGGVIATLKAAAVPRMQTISGWDLAAERTDVNGRVVRGAPKPTRRLAPAGSVYFVEFPDDVDVQTWLDATWMCNISDDAQDDQRQVNADQHRLDGFGLAVVGTWPR